MPDQPESVRIALGEVTASPEFAGSPRLSQLLEYLVEEVLEGRAERLKGYTIGVDVFDKGEDFDPGVDSLVRVQMNRLRSALDSYYSNSGKDDPLRIVLSKGSYVPEFELVVPEEAPEEAPEESPIPARALLPVPVAAEPRAQSAPRPGPWKRIALVLMLLAFVAAGAWLLRDGEGNAEDLASLQPTGPTVLVSPYSIVGGTQHAATLRDGLQHDLITYLAQLPNIGVIGFETAASSSADSNETMPQIVDFILNGSITISETEFKVNSNLIRRRDGVVIWSQSTGSVPLETTNVLKMQTDLALAVASELGQPYGVIHQAMRAELESHRGVSMDHYLCELHAYDYMRAKSRDGFTRVRECLERIVAAVPGDSHARGLLAWMYGDEERFMYESGSGQRGSRKAVEAAQKAVEANTTDPMAYQYLAIAQFYTGDDDGALDSIDRAMRLSPNNAEILADSSWLLASIENNDQALPLAEKAISLNPGHPAWYWLGPVLQALQAGEAEEGLRLARLLAADSSPLSAYLLAAALQMNGKDEEAGRVLLEKSSTFPQVVGRFEENLAYWRLPEPLVELVRQAGKEARRIREEEGISPARPG